MIKIYDFVTSSEYDLVNTIIDSGGKFDFVDKTGLHFVQDFSTPFSVDAAALEFVAGVLRQIDKKLNAAVTSWATYTSNINLNFGGGVLTGVATGGAAVAGNKLDLAHDDLRYVSYSGTLNAPGTQTGTIRKKFTPNYSGTPSNNQIIYSLTKAAGDTTNAINIQHSAGGDLRAVIKDSSDVVIFAVNFAAFSPTAGVEYEIELNYDISGGASRLFLNGVQQGATDTSTGTRDGNIGLLRIGSNEGATADSNFSLADLIVFSTVQHTANYTPGYALEETRYLASVATLPTFNYTGLGEIQSVDGVVKTGSNVPDHLVVFDADSVDVDLEFVASNTRQDISNLDVEYTGEEYVVLGSITTLDGLEALVINSIAETIVEPGAGNIVKLAIIKTALKYYHDGSNWVLSDGSESQTNTFADALANISTLLDENELVNFYFLLIGADGSETPEITEFIVDYLFGGIEPDEALRSSCFLYVEDIEGVNIEGAKVTIEVNRDIKQYVEAADRAISTKVSKLTDSNGYVAFELPYSSEFDTSSDIPLYKMTIEKENIDLLMQLIGRSSIEFDVPDQLKINIATLIQGK